MTHRTRQKIDAGLKVKIALLVLMRRIDEFITAWPFLGSQRMPVCRKYSPQLGSPLKNSTLATEAPA
jgi:hypothetical protein